MLCAVYRLPHPGATLYTGCRYVLGVFGCRTVVRGTPLSPAGRTPATVSASCILVDKPIGSIYGTLLYPRSSPTDAHNRTGHC